LPLIPVWFPSRLFSPPSLFLFSSTPLSLSSRRLRLLQLPSLPPSPPPPSHPSTF